MKKVTLLSAVFILALGLNSFSQDEGGGGYKPFKVDVSMGYAVPTGGGSGAKGGLLFAVEPKYSVTDAITVGLRMEGALLVSGIPSIGDDEDDIFSSTASAKLNSSYLATGDYYFMPAGGFRAFGGLGAGIFQTTAASFSGDDGGTGRSSKFGGMIRGGVEYKHFRFGVEYNLIPKTEIEVIEGDNYSIKNGYLGVKFGVLIGGGKK